MGRFQEVYHERKRYYCQGGPVVIETWAIQKDLINGAVIAQVKLTNISHREIVACKVLINEYEINGEIIKAKVEYSYLDLHAKYGDSFGTKKPIYMEPNTRRISVIVSEVVYDNGDCWKTDNEWEIVPEQKKLDGFIENKKLLEEYIRINRSGEFIPQKWNNTFLCACGAVNINSETKCYCCGALFENITKYLDLTLLNDAMQKRIAEEERIKQIEEEKLLQSKIQNRARRKRIILVTLLLIFIFSVSGYFLINSDMIQRPMTYNQAMEYYETGDYGEAIKLFKKISSYKDSAEMLKKSIYLKAEECYEDKDYYNALFLWQKIEDYSDSSERIENTKWRINNRKNRY